MEAVQWLTKHRMNNLMAQETGLMCLHLTAAMESLLCCCFINLCHLILWMWIYQQKQNKTNTKTCTLNFESHITLFLFTSAGTGEMQCEHYYSAECVHSPTLCISQTCPSFCLPLWELCWPLQSRQQSLLQLQHTLPL